MTRLRSTAICVLVAGMLAVPATGLAIDLDNPDLFGPGEGWDRPGSLAEGDSGPWVIRLQERLIEAGFRPGDVDGVFDAVTLGAVYAFQKVHGLERDGIFDAEDWAALEAGLQIHLPPSEEHPDRVEVDLDRQVLFLVFDNEVESILPISSGNGEVYRGRAGRFVRANTPEGSYVFGRRIDGWRISYLGGLYRPFYFLGGYAIHGSYNVPPYPDSHGCVRVELHDMDYLVTRLQIGMPVHLYGIDVDRGDLLEA
ncbi:MAG TPA: L,D-transpeptidase family protein [Acidimicrobiia bacterium]|nr:L,D-transpeptidase family protein [Acidimicrobiia bacterium]